MTTFFRVGPLLLLAFFPIAGSAVPQRALVNLSARVVVGTGNNAPIMTFTIEGVAAKTVLLRGVGPGLAQFGVPGSLADPTLTIYSGSGTVIATNDNWGGLAELKSAFAFAGAFALPDGSRDSAVLLTVNPGTYAARLSGIGNTSGTALIELYDMDTNPRLASVSIRAQAGTGTSTLLPGFTIIGTPQTVLVRALGPTLGAYGIPGAMADPILRVFLNSASIATNDNWSGTDASGAATNSGLLPLADGSRDSASLLVLSQGSYTAQISGANGGTGISILEVALSDADRSATFAPALLAPLPNQSAAIGSTVRIGASYIAKPFAVSFQWKKNGANIAGATSSMLTLLNVQAFDAGDYSVAISNSAGTTTTAAATLTVTAESAPTIATQPSSQTVAGGGTAIFSVVASGSPAPTYQWLFNGTAIAGATSPTLTRTNVQTASLGTYSVRVTNSLGSVTSSGALLTIAPPPVITTQPTSLSLTAGAAASFTVTANGTTPLSYQWRKDGAAIAGATSATFSIPATQLADAGSYTCVVTNVGGSVTTTAATLTVVRNFEGTYFGSFDGGRGSWALVVRNDRVATFVGFLNNPRAGIVATMTVATDGRFRTESSLIQPLSAAPIIGGRNAAAAATPFTISGAIGATSVTGSLEGLNVPFTGTLDASVGLPSPLSGIYQATGAVSAGTTYTVVGSSGRTVLAMTIGPTLVDGGLGATTGLSNFSVTTPENTRITGTIGAATGSITTTITPATGAPVTVTGSVTGGLGAPVITDLPTSQSVTVGASVTLALTAGGRTPLTYQWKKDGSEITGATTATFRLATSQLTDAGVYTCVITNGDGVITSAPVTITVAGTARIVNLSILTDIVNPGDNVTLGYVISGNSVTNAKPLVIRAAGPSLGALGVPGTVDDPKLELFAGGTKTGENDNWGGSAPVAAAMATVGAFPYSNPTSRDSALLANITTSNNSVVVSAAGTGTGAVIAEVYDATPNEAYTAATPRLINVSVIKQIDSGFTVGFVIGGTGTKTVLVRAVGPGLSGVGVASGFLADPRLTLFAGSAVTDENDNWGGTPGLTAVMAQNGAFALPAASRDATLLATLPPGSYSARVDGPAGASGLVLVEVYDVP